ncbi:hypothetical protein NUACC21_49400 [Scytonema sp. NUACC21]
MKNGQCPKCGSLDVRSGAKLPFKAGMHNNNSILLKGCVISPSYAPLDNYVCLNCGYVESYISNSKHIDFIAQNWPPVSDLEHNSLFLSKCYTTKQP